MIKSIVRRTLGDEASSVLPDVGQFNILTSPEPLSLEMLSPFAKGKEFPPGTTIEITTEANNKLVSIFDIEGRNLIQQNPHPYGLDMNKAVYIDFLALEDLHIGYYLLKLYNLLTECQDIGFSTLKQGFLKMARISPELLAGPKTVEDITLSQFDNSLSNISLSLGKYHSLPIQELVNKSNYGGIRSQPLIVASLLMVTTLAYIVHVNVAKLNSNIDLVVFCNIQVLTPNIRYVLNQVLTVLENSRSHTTTQFIMTECQQLPQLT